MKPYASDVNTIFAYVDITHKFNKIAIAFLDDVKNGSYILLRHVTTSFLYTYSERLKTMGNMILKSVNEIKEELKQRKLKRPASSVLKTIFLNKRLEDIMKQNRDFDSNDYSDFKDLMLSKYPLLVLLEDGEKTNEFRIKFIEEANKTAKEKLSSFLKFVGNFTIKINKVDENKNRIWQGILKKSKENDVSIFNDPDDDDIILSAEFLTVVENRRLPINFGTMDENLAYSLDYIKKDKKVKCGDIIFLLKEYKNINC